MEEVSLGELDVTDAPLVQHALRVLRHGSQIDTINFSTA